MRSGRGRGMRGLGSLRDLLRLGFVAAMVLLVVALPAAADNNTESVTAAATAAVGDLVINEIDYDQPSFDLSEYLEIKNVSAGGVSLDGVILDYINGNAGGAV